MTWLCDATRAFITRQRDAQEVEAQLPTLLMQGMADAGLSIHAHALGAQWAGVTFRADAEALRKRLVEATRRALYPSPLWSP